MVITWSGIGMEVWSIKFGVGDWYYKQGWIQELLWFGGGERQLEKIGKMTSEATGRAEN